MTKPTTQRARMIWLAAYVVTIGAGLAACGGDDDPLSGPAKSVAELEDPATCNACHPKHFSQWSASMHAYASDDPVFVAMNARGQRETSGALGTFCVQCHAPMAVALKLTNGTDFDPSKLTAASKGITCYFCHNVAQVKDTHNNGLVLAMDQTMRGGANKPVASPAHHSTYDKLMDSTVNESEMCGSCHDVVTPAPHGVQLERTFAEWKTTFFAQDDTSADQQHHLTCGACHMQSSTDVIADAPGLNVVERSAGYHEHLWPGIDQALTKFPGTDTLAAAIKRDLDPAVAIIGPAQIGSNIQIGGICLNPADDVSVRMDSIGTGHAWPSGAAQDRRAWLEISAYNAPTESAASLVFQRGAIDATVDPDDAEDAAVIGFWDRVFKDDGTTPAHFFWEVASVQPRTLKPPTTLDKNSPAFDHSTTVHFTIPNSGSLDHINARIHIRPMSYAMLDDLVASGDLDASVPSNLPTLEIVGTQRTWTAANAGKGRAANTGCDP